MTSGEQSFRWYTAAIDAYRSCLNERCQNADANLVNFDVCAEACATSAEHSLQECICARGAGLGSYVEDHQICVRILTESWIV